MRSSVRRPSPGRPRFARLRALRRPACAGLFGPAGAPSAERFHTRPVHRAAREPARARPEPGGRPVRRRAGGACRDLGRLPCRAVAVAGRLGPSHPRRAAEPCSSSAGSRLGATPIKIRTAGRSTRPRGPASTPPAPRPTCPAGSGVWGRGCSALHFPGAPIRQVSCNTLLGGFRLLWPPSCCLDRRTPFALCAPLAPRNAA